MDDLRTFVAVVEGGSFSRAARQLDLPRATVSRRIARLEARLGLRLVERNTRHMRTTPAGEDYYTAVADCLQGLDDAEARLAEDETALAGPVRMTAPVTPGAFFLADWVGDFLRDYPGVDLDLRLTDRMVDLVADDVDVALRAGPLEDTGLVARTIGFTRRLVCAAPSLVEARGRPRSPAELAEWPAVRFTAAGGDAGRHWPLRGPGGARAQVAIRGHCTVDEMNLVRRLALAGSGVALIPEFVCGADLAAGRLVRLLEDWEGPGAPFHLVTTGRRFRPRRVEALVDHLARRAAAEPWLEAARPERWRG